MQYPLRLPDSTSTNHGTQEVLNRIRAVISDMDTPAWLPSVPRNYGLAAAGTLKADEWRTMATVYFPIALVSMWGEGSVHRSEEISKSARLILDHTMLLVSAISLACMRTTTAARIQDYQDLMLAWLSQLKTVHPNPDVTHKSNGHMAVHISDFLRLFGPVRSWWCFPFERLIGQMQRFNHNHKFGKQIHECLTSLQPNRYHQVKWSPQ